MSLLSSSPLSGRSRKTPQVQPLRADEVKASIEEFDEGFGDVVAGIPKCGYGEHPSLARALIGQ